MPLSPEYSFTQTAAAVSLHVALKGTPKRKVDIYIADVFVKINIAPYLLQLDLCAAVSLERCVARFDQRDGKLHVVLEKAAPAEWEALTFTPPRAASSGEKRRILQERRAASMARKEAYDAGVRELVKERRHKNEKMTLRRQMAVEEDERQHIEELKAEEKEDAERAVYETFTQLQQEQVAQRDKKHGAPAAKTGAAAAATAAAAGVSDEKTKKTKKKDKIFAATATTTNKVVAEVQAAAAAVEPVFESPAARARAAKAAAAAEKALAEAAAEEKAQSTLSHTRGGGIRSDSDDDEANDAAADAMADHGAHEEEEELEFVPDPRSSSTIKLGFTERFFPTPMRESKLQDVRAAAPMVISS